MNHSTADKRSAIATWHYCGNELSTRGSMPESLPRVWTQHVTHERVGTHPAVGALTIDRQRSFRPVQRLPGPPTISLSANVPNSRTVCLDRLRLFRTLFVFFILPPPGSWRLAVPARRCCLSGKICSKEHRFFADRNYLPPDRRSGNV